MGSFHRSSCKRKLRLAAPASQVRLVGDLVAKLLGGDRPESSSLIELIESSLGDCRSFATSRSKSRLISAAQALKIPCPPTNVVNSYQDIDRQLGRIVYPVLIKLDESWGGLGVRLAHNQRELLRATLELSFPLNWHWLLKRLAAEVIQRLPDRWRLNECQRDTVDPEKDRCREANHHE
jgi:hypothetical protein